MAQGKFNLALVLWSACGSGVAWAGAQGRTVTQAVNAAIIEANEHTASADMYNGQPRGPKYLFWFASNIQWRLKAQNRGTKKIDAVMRKYRRHAADGSLAFAKDPATKVAILDGFRRLVLDLS